LERENNFLANQDIILSETKYPENKKNMLIYLLSLILLLTIQKERSPSLLDLSEQDAIQANSPVSESLPETSQIPNPTPNQPRGTGSY
jgi:hypothetical protein